MDEHIHEALSRFVQGSVSDGSGKTVATATSTLLVFSTADGR